LTDSVKSQQQQVCSVKWFYCTQLYWDVF